MGDPLGSSRVSFQKQNREGVHDAFWELASFRFHRNSEVKRVEHESTHMMGDPLESSRVSSYKQNREGMVEAQNEQYHATAELSPGCGRGPGQDVTIWYQS
ncbi:unnamed protein product [Malus baccata var. baccata]